MSDDRPDQRALVRAPAFAVGFGLLVMSGGAPQLRPEAVNPFAMGFVNSAGMSAIRPDLPAPAPAAPAVKTAQAAFFRAALAEVQAARSAPVETARPTATSAKPAAEPARALRPGALLDIRV